MDRNFPMRRCSWPIVPTVALRKESVDRNMREDVSYNIKETSLSARRAWIEIGASHNFCIFLSVALRKESVDRNSTTRIGKKVENTSLSARRAWIEIPPAR